MSICAAVTFTVLLVSANTMAMSVRERIREVGILKTLGYTPGTILFLILGEAGVLSLLGGAIGLLLAVGLTTVVRNGPSFIQAMKTLTITPDVGARAAGRGVCHRCRQFVHSRVQRVAHADSRIVKEFRLIWRSLWHTISAI